MLRTNYPVGVRKRLGVPPLCSSESKEVLVDLIDPVTKSKVTSHVEHVPFVSVLPDSSFCSQESADLYSIENMQKMGITPPVAPSNFIRPNLDSVSDIENYSADVLNKLDEADENNLNNQPSEPSSEPKSE